MIRVAVPIDIGIIEATGSDAFARATPLRIDQLVTMAVHEALGARAPQDKRERTLHAALAGLCAGQFTLDVDGRTFRSPDEIVVCEGTATLRFFATQSRKAIPTSHRS